MNYASGPFLTRTEAAKHVGYSTKYFNKLLEQYNIPRYGPGKTRFAQSDLDAFMNFPEKFRKDQSRRYSRKPQLLTVE